MQDVLSFIIKNITTVPDEVQIQEEVVDGVTNYNITASPADVGRIIGKEGKVIKAIRTIMRTIAIQKGLRVRVSVVSDQDQVQVEEQAPQAETPASSPVVAEDPDSISVEM